MSASPPPPPPGALDRTLLTGFRWNAASKLSGQLLTWASTFVVVRLLSPADYGIVAMGGVVFGLAVLVGDGGIGSAILNKRESRPDHLGQLTTISVLLGVAATLLTIILAFPLAVFFDEPKLRSVVMVASLAYLVLGFRAVPLAELQRDLAFSTIARNDFLMVTTTAVAAIALAALGMAYWALIIAPVLGACTATAAAWQARPQRLRIPRWADLRETLAFGGHLMISRVSGYVGTQADSVVIGRLLGKPALGAYRVAMDLASLPIEKVASLVLQVTTPILAAVRGDREATARYLFRITEVVALVTWPLAIGLALVADLVVPIVIGPQWDAAIVPLQIFAITGAIRCTTPLLSGVVLASGDARFVGRITLWLTVASVPALIGVVGWGLPALAAVTGLTITVSATAMLWRALLAINAPLRQYAASLLPAATGCSVMALAVLGARATIADRVSPAILLVAVVAVGGVSYLGAVLTFARPRVMALVAFLRDRRAPVVT